MAGRYSSGKVQRCFAARQASALVLHNAWLGTRAKLLLAAACYLAAVSPAMAVDADDPTQAWNAHGQFTLVAQSHGRFNSPYEGLNSLYPGSSAKETADLTAFLGARLWSGGELYVNPEIDQGFGLSDTVGIAGFPSGEAYKVGDASPYFRLNRLFVRQVIALGDAQEHVDSSANALGGTRPTDNVMLTLGKLSVVDIFDTNTYAHDPRADFLNWSIIDAGAFDYAADAWGYTYGGSLEWTQSWWTVRTGVFALSEVPNSKVIDRSLRQYSVVAEFEGRHELFGHPGKIKLLGFVNRGRMASYDDALRLAQTDGTVPDVSLVRRMASRPGASVNLEQEITHDLGVFARASANDGSKEAFEFTEINRSVTAGASLKGSSWHRPGDTAGAAFVVNGISAAARAYFAAGGIGILIGDGKLNYASERILEVYYSAALDEHLSLAMNFQRVVDPAYNRDRGPVSIFGVRLHAEF
jgi:high affinity Mn2+ porin